MDMVTTVFSEIEMLFDEIVLIYLASLHFLTRFKRLPLKMAIRFDSRRYAFTRKLTELRQMYAV